MNDDVSYARIKALADKNAQEGNHLGTLCWWTLNGGMITHKDLVTRAKDAGLDEKFLPHAIKPVAAFRRAWRNAQKKVPEGLLLREIGETPDRIAVGLVKESADVTNDRLDYDLLCTFTFDKKTDAVSVSAHNDVTDEVLRLYEKHHDHGTEDIRSMLTNFTSKASVSLRDAGGVYFIPPPFLSPLGAMVKVVEGIGHNRIFTLPVADTVEAKNTLAIVARETLDDEIRAVEEELHAFALADKETRDSTLKRRLDSFAELRARVQLFSHTLSFKADVLLDKLSSAQAELKARIEGRSTREPGPAVNAVSVPPSTASPASTTAGRPTPATQQTAQAAFDDSAGF